MILLSRSGRRAGGASPDWDTLQSLSSVGVLLGKGDAAEECSIARMASPTLHGLWHAAGVLSDALAVSQTTTSLRHAFAPKAAGVMSLHRLTHTMPVMDSFVMFSSIAA
eukprot:357833-Prymnesium_polylepis.1